MYELLRNPEMYIKAQQEVDSVVGKGPITVDHLSKLPYISAVLRETLRLDAPIPLFGVEPIEDTLLGGKYPVAKGEVVLNLLAKAHLDPKVFGDDVEEFRPERMLDDNFDRLNREFPNCWKPFGNGMRACIGRPFAWQEALLVMVMLLQNFNFVPEHGYSLKLKQTLTIKPKDFHFRAILRDGMTPTELECRLAGRDSPQAAKKAAQGPDRAVPEAKGGVPITVLYGSNSGTCESLAQRLASDAPAHGFRVASVDCLDVGKGALPTEHPVVVITSSYEGQPPDNAGHFVAWAEEQAKSSGDGNKKPLAGVPYAVFGCGNKDWVQTFHRIPKLVDECLEKAGAERLVAVGLSDVSQGTTFTDFETWEDETLWPALEARYKAGAEGAADGKQGSGMKVEVLNPRTSALRQDVKEASVVEARSLTGGSNVKRHIEVKLPEGMTYTTGDYLAVLPLNPERTIHRAMRRLQIPRDAHLSISSEGHTSLPVNVSVPATHVLGAYVELSQPATKRVSSSSQKQNQWLGLKMLTAFLRTSLLSRSTLPTRRRGLL